MMIQIVVDMNLSPDWVTALTGHGWHTRHWSTVGDARATDREIMDWALANGYVVFTHDLDFGTLLALTHASGPSVIQLRGQNVLPDAIEAIVVGAIRLYEADLAAGALVVIDAGQSRVRVLPI
jgi:predicted nuclease of predicted toxin-antitoxin system